MPEDKDKFNLIEDPAFKKLLETMGTLGQMVKEGQSASAATTEGLARLTASMSEDRKPAPKPGVTEDDLNDMDQASLVTHLTKAVSEIVDTKMSGLNKNLEDFKGSVDTKDAKGVIVAFAEKHPEVYGYGAQLKQIFDETPGISMERAYNLVKSENPELVVDVEAKYLDKTDVVKEKKTYGGLTPTSRISSGDDDTGKDEKMDANEAADVAWKEAMEDFPAIAETGE